MSITYNEDMQSTESRRRIKEQKHYQDFNRNVIPSAWLLCDKILSFVRFGRDLAMEFYRTACIQPIELQFHLVDVKFYGMSYKALDVLSALNLVRYWTRPTGVYRVGQKSKPDNVKCLQ